MGKKRIAIKISDLAEDILSAAPLVGSLKKKNPDYEVGFLSKTNGHEICSLVPGLDFVDLEESENSYEKIYDLSGDSWDQIYSESINWKSYLLSLPSIKIGNPYHKIDLYRKVADVDTIDINFELNEVKNSESDAIEAIAIGGTSLKIAICMSSTPLEIVVETIKSLEQLSFPCTIYLLGTIKDRKKTSDLVLNCSKMAIDLCGRISSLANATILRSCDLTICGPGASALLSSGYGTFTICYDANPENGPILYPYGHGHLIFQPHIGVERDQHIFSTLLHKCIEYAVLGNNGNVPTLEKWQTFIDSNLEETLSKIRIMGTQRVELVLSEKESFTELHLRPLLYMGAEYFEVLKTFYRLIWEHSLNNRTISTNDLEILNKETVPAMCQLLKPLEKLYEVANFGSKYSEYIGLSLSSGNLEKAKTDSERLQEVETLLHSLGDNFSALQPLCAFHEKKQALLPDQNPTALAEEMSQLFNDLKSRILIMFDLEKSLFDVSVGNESSPNNSSVMEAKIE